MKLLSRAQIARRLVLFGVMGSALVVAITAVQLALGVDSPVTLWTPLAAGLGAWSIVVASRWRGGDHGEQAEWQPRAFLQVLNGGFSFQAGVIAYFVSNDLVAAFVGLAGFLAVLAIVLRTLRRLEFAGQ